MADGPPSETDILRAERDAWAQELFECNRHAAELAVERQTLTDALQAAQAKAEADAEAQIEARADAQAEARAQLEAAWQERDAARAAARDAEARLHRVTASTSWRMTAPLRRAVAALLGRPGGGA